jgi:hypothetical protein
MVNLTLSGDAAAALKALIQSSSFAAAQAKSAAREAPAPDAMELEQLIEEALGSGRPGAGGDGVDDGDLQKAKAGLREMGPQAVQFARTGDRASRYSRLGRVAGSEPGPAESALATDLVRRTGCSWPAALKAIRQQG